MSILNARFNKGSSFSFNSSSTQSFEPSALNADPNILCLPDVLYFVFSLAPDTFEYVMLLNEDFMLELNDLLDIDCTILFSDEHGLIIHSHSNMFRVNHYHLKVGQRVLHSYRSRMKYFIIVVRFRIDL